LQKVQGIGYPSEVFLRGFFFEPDIKYQSADKELTTYRHPDAPPITGSFSTSWQSLDEVERKCRASIRTDIDQLQIVPIKLAHWSWAKEIARECQCAADEQHEHRKTWERNYLRKDAHGNFYQADGSPAMPEFEPICPRTRWGLEETLMVDIAWDCFTNDEIVNYFRKWVKSARPKNAKAPSGQGHKPKDWRANLTRLAVMRLLARFTPLEIVDPRRNGFPAVWETKQFAGRKWSDVTKWHDARREAGKEFRALFSFLPKDEKPISWERQKPGK
jgi:hypothetical protein